MFVIEIIWLNCHGEVAIAIVNWVLWECYVFLFWQREEVWDSGGYKVVGQGNGEHAKCLTYPDGHFEALTFPVAGINTFNFDAICDNYTCAVSVLVTCSFFPEFANHLFFPLY